MGLVEFDFIDRSLEILKEIKPSLDRLALELERYFEDILIDQNEEYLNVKSRVKSEESLREKIIRNRYLNKYGHSSDLLSRLSDLIGIRLECRFIEDEAKLYKALREHFDTTDDLVYFYNKSHEHIRIRLDKKQPRKQKNGFEIFRIDGYIIDDVSRTNFEIQIKSLVNIFWSEIEHKIIYKNNTYLIADKFLKDMMTNIRSNLIMMDTQLLNIYKNFKNPINDDEDERKKEMEKFLAKITYDTFSLKMQESIGFVVDFKKPIETILSYTFNKRDDQSYSDILIKELSKINEIAKKEIDFNSEIEFEADLEFDDPIHNRLGMFIKTKINREFTWNLFFRILFELEPDNNKGDFEKFIKYICDIVFPLRSKSRLYYYYQDQASEIIEDLHYEIVNTITSLNSVEILYKSNLSIVQNAVDEYVITICSKYEKYSSYVENKQHCMNEIHHLIQERLGF